MGLWDLLEYNSKVSSPGTCDICHRLSPELYHCSCGKNYCNRCAWFDDETPLSLCKVCEGNANHSFTVTFRGLDGTDESV